MKIAFAKGNQMNIKLERADMTFVELADYLGTCQKGGKHENYFIRGGDLEHTEEHISTTGKNWGAGYFRSDKYLNSADLLVIDGDMGLGGGNAPEPKNVAKALENLGLAYILYTTHSHSESKNKFRVVIPTNRPYSQSELRPTMTALLNKLSGEGCPIEPVKEMFTWSQPWFVPTRDDPEDGLFEFYRDMSGDDFNVREATGDAGGSSRDNSNSSSDSNNDSESIDTIIKTIIEGKDGLHHAVNKYAWMQINDGVPAGIVKATLKGLMQGCPHKDERWQQRFDDVDRAVDSVIDKETNMDTSIAKRLDSLSESIEEIDEEENEEMLSWPPGNMGKLAKAVYKYSDYPNRVVSIVTALGLVAGISGRRFNVNGSGLNLYLTLLMHTGEGKSVIDSFISRALSDGNLFGGNYGFMGARRYTGGKSLMENLDKHRCIISVFTEAGFMFKSKSGDQSGLTRTILDLYGKSGAGESMQSEAYSNDKDSIPAVISPSFSMINESTPDVFLETLKNGTETGELTRMNIFRVSAECHKINRQKKYDLGNIDDDKSLLSIIKNLIAFCNKTQNADDSDPLDVIVTDEMYAFSDRCKKESLDCRDRDGIRADMLSRVGLKTWKVASLCSVLESNITPDYDNSVSITEDAWNWASELAEYELNGLGKFFKSSGDDSLDDIVYDHILVPIAKIVRIDPKFYKSKRDQVAKADIKRHGYVFKLSILRRVTKKVKALQQLNRSEYGRSGFDTIVKYMVDSKYIELFVKSGTQYVRIMNELVEMIEDKYELL